MTLDSVLTGIVTGVVASIIIIVMQTRDRFKFCVNVKN